MTAAVLTALVLRSLAQARYVLFGSLCLLSGFQVILVGQAAALEQQNSLSRMVDLLPGFVQRGLGNKAMVFASFKGTVSFGYFHPVILLILASLAIYLTTEVAHEVESGLVDIELARSVPRHALLTRSLLAASGAIVVACMLMAFGTWAGLRAFASPHFDAPSPGLVVRLLAHLALVSALFGAIGLALAAGARRWSPAFFTAALSAGLLYLLDFLAIGWPAMKSVTWISPFHYYPALSIIYGDAPTPRNIAVLLAGIAVFVAIAYRRFERRDL